MGTIKYVKAFDGLRGIAVMMLLLYHFPGKYITIRHGWEFMQMFFVMSGYLISLTLLEDSKKYAFRKYAVHFYLKRALRLFPLYFLYILVCSVVYLLFSDIPDIQKTFGNVYQHLIYLLTFSFNYMQLINNALGKDYTVTFMCGHLWTISIEEQFYLVFPFIFFFLRIKNIKRVMIAAIVIAPIFRVLFFMYLRHLNPGDIAWASLNLSRIPFCQMDSLALGAALAVFNTDWIKHPGRWWLITFVLIITAYAANLYYVYFVQGLDYYKVTYGLKFTEKWITHNYLFAYIISMVNIWCALTILCIRRNMKYIRFLEFKPLVFLGKLSYGIYLLHLPMLPFLIVGSYLLLGGKQYHPYILYEATLFLVFVSIIVGTSYISFTYFESYFLRLKKKLN